MAKASKASGARVNPLSKASSSKKKKKGVPLVGHSASLGDDLEKLNNPGKLKPIAASAGGKGAASGKAATKEDVKLENQLLLAGKTSSAANKKKQKAGAAAAPADEDEMEDDDGEDGPDFGDEDEDDDEQKARDHDAAFINARLSKKIMQQVTCVGAMDSAQRDR